MRSRAGAARPQSGAAAQCRRARSAPSVVRLVRGLASDVVGDPFLGRLEPLEQLLRRHYLLRLAAEQPGSAVDRRFPGNLLDRLGRALLGRLLQRLDTVEV